MHSQSVFMYDWALELLLYVCMYVCMHPGNSELVWMSIHGYAILVPYVTSRSGQLSSYHLWDEK